MAKPPAEPADIRSMNAMRSAIGVVGVALGLTMIAVAVTGIGNDWLGGWLIRCGGRYMRHRCEAGEIPWRLVFWGGVFVFMGMLVGCAGTVIRHGRTTMSVRIERRSGASVAPPSPSGPGRAAPADDIDALSRKIGL